MNLVLLRHGQSVWNLENKFTGWTDVDLSDHGRQEAHRAGQLLRKRGFAFDVAFTSVLKRAIRTLWIVLDDLDLMWIPIHCSWRLNERHYGALQGLDKKATVQEYGDEQVRIWRRSYATPPPLLESDDLRYQELVPRYRALGVAEPPRGESLKDTLDRVRPYWYEVITPALRQGRRVVIAAHGNSLRALVKHLEGISDDDILQLEIPTGVPLVYELDEHLRTTEHFFLDGRVTRAMQ